MRFRIPSPVTKNFIARIIDYYGRSNVDRTFEKKLDWSIAPGPNYSSDVGFGIGFLDSRPVSAGSNGFDDDAFQFCCLRKRNDPEFALLRQRHQYFQAESLSCLLFRGDGLFSRRFLRRGLRRRKSGIRAGADHEMYKVRGERRRSIAPKAYAGMTFSLDYTGAKSKKSSATERSFLYYESVVDKVLQESGGTIGGAQEAYDRLDAQEKAVFNGYSYGDGNGCTMRGATVITIRESRSVRQLCRIDRRKSQCDECRFGAFLQYDSRDVLTSPYKGIFFNLDIKYFPRWLGNSLHTFGKIQVTSTGIRKRGKGACWLTTFDGNFTMGVPSWHMYSSLGGMERMRGYYEGRYRDRTA